MRSETESTWKEQPERQQQSGIPQNQKPKKANYPRGVQADSSDELGELSVLDTASLGLVCVVTGKENNNTRDIHCD